MARYIDADVLLKEIQDNEPMNWTDSEAEIQEQFDYKQFKSLIENQPTADVVKVKHGEWTLEVHSFYVDNWDESIELCVYILASCSNCGEEHKPKQVFSKHLYAPEDADDDFRFDQEYEKSKALEEFKQQGYKFKNYCPNCGAKMDGKGGADE